MSKDFVTIRATVEVQVDVTSEAYKLWQPSELIKIGARGDPRVNAVDGFKVTSAYTVAQDFKVVFDLDGQSLSFDVRAHSKQKAILIAKPLLVAWVRARERTNDYAAIEPKTCVEVNLGNS